MNLGKEEITGDKLYTCLSVWRVWRLRIVERKALRMSKGRDKVVETRCSMYRLGKYLHFFGKNRGSTTQRDGSVTAGYFNYFELLRVTSNTSTRSGLLYDEVKERNCRSA